MRLETYCEAFEKVWNNLVENSRNGTFLLDRRFMDYHKERFIDASLLFFDSHDKLLGIFPACYVDNKVVSHAGLTYGGFVLSKSAHCSDVGKMMDLCKSFYCQHGYTEIIIKPIPYIYHNQPSDDELYWLFRNSCELKTRAVSTAVKLSSPLPFSTLRERKVKLSKKSDYQCVVYDNHNCKSKELSIEERQSWQLFWNILERVLLQRHACSPVHSLDEILLLKSRFPNEIVLAVVTDKSKTIVAGTVLFLTNCVVHSQYIAASDDGRSNGALDLMFKHLIDYYSKPRSQSFQNLQTNDSSNYAPSYFDFGISTESGGTLLNDGLIFQKEGFGGRSVVYDSYSIKLKR